MAQKNNTTSKTNKSSATPLFYKLDVANLPDDLFQADVPVEKWLDRCESTSDKEGFPVNSLNKVAPLEWDVHVERLVGIALYMVMNVLPFMIIPMAVLYWGVATKWAKTIVQGILVYVLVLAALETFVFQPLFVRKYRQRGYLEADAHDFRRNQYVFTERNTTKYMSTTFVWGQSIHPPALHASKRGVLFCIVPHGVAPFGITAYPIWSKLWNARLCRWTTAPVVLSIPVVGYLIRKIGYIPAKSPEILDALQSGHNVGVILDGIAGMFHQGLHEETAFLKQRKGIVKIALKAGVPIIPVYGFGHTAAYTVLVDPFGVLEVLSNKLQASLTPFLGRWLWLLGPPRRVPITVCLGNPVNCPNISNPTQQQIDDYHSQLLHNYLEVFNQHKHAYGWKEKRLHFV